MTKNPRATCPLACTRDRGNLHQHQKDDFQDLCRVDTPHLFSVDCTPWWHKIDLKIMRKTIQNAYPIRNFTLNNFAIHNRFNVPDVYCLERYEGTKPTICTISSRYTANSTSDPYISQTIADMEPIMEGKIIQNEIIDGIGVLHDFCIAIWFNFFDVWIK